MIKKNHKGYKLYIKDEKNFSITIFYSNKYESYNEYAMDRPYEVMLNHCVGVTIKEAVRNTIDKTQILLFFYENDQITTINIDDKIKKSNKRW